MEPAFEKPTRPPRARAIPRYVLAGFLLAGSFAFSLSSSASELWSSAVETADDADSGEANDPASVDREYRRAMAKADSYAIQAAEVKAERSMHVPRRVRAYLAIVDNAVRFYEKAAKLKPSAGEPHYRAAEVLHTHLLERPSTGTTFRDRTDAERTLAHWNAFEKLAPLDPRLLDMLDRRAIVHTRLATEADIANAILDYEAMLSRSPSVNPRWLGNMAESYMMVGRIDDAIATYRRALEYSNEPLHGYGLAIALDRDGQGEQARQVMWAYAMGDRMRSLEVDSVFFVPEGEVHYYYALGREVMGDLRGAARHYRLFIASGAHPRYQPRARENLKAVQEKLAKKPRKKVPKLPGGLGF